MTFTIREMCSTDLPQVMTIEKACFPSPWSRGVFLQELESAPDRVWRVAEDSGEVVGYGGLAVFGEEAHILNLAVRSDSRRRGIARCLAKELMASGGGMGARGYTLEVRSENKAARSLYESLGFRSHGVRPGYYPETGDDALIMWTHETAPDDPGDGRSEDLVLAIETSCDETAAAVVRGGTQVLADVVASQVDFHARFGGVVPEIASRKHIEAVCAVVDEALGQAGVDFDDLSALAVTHGPGLVGALVVGLSYAKGLALATGLPLIGVNHLEGHIIANTLEDARAVPPLVALVVSGGHTSLVHVPAWGEYRMLGQTLDDAAGEAFDKVAKVLGLGYPGGPAISRIAQDGDPGAIDFPRALMHSGDFAFSLSGLKTAVITYVRDEQAAGRELDLPDIAASFQRAVVDVQVSKTLRAALELGVSTVALAGGVAANRELRERLGDALAGHGIHLSVPRLSLCTDNAVMIAVAAHHRLYSGPFLGLDAEAHPGLTLD